MGDRFDPAYLVALDEIYHSHWVARKKRRSDRLRAAVEHFWPAGHPARLIHVSGTNGKGTVAHYLEQGLRCSGATGSWTGPHVFDYAERFHVGGRQVSHAEIVEIYRQQLVPYQDRVRSRRPQDPLGFAELGILLSLHLFARHDVTWGVMESGVGGRYTPLMALPMAACIVTNVGEDHPVSLGPELWQRALNKAGIARRGVPFFTAASGEALGYVVATAESEGATVHALGEGDFAEIRERLGAAGGASARHGLANLALALAVVRHFHPDRDPGAILESMSSRLPGRFSSPEPGVIVDVAHNRDKIAHLAEQLKLAHPGEKFRFLLGLTRQRDPLEVFRPLFEVAERIVVTGASYAGRDPEEVAGRLREFFQPVAAVADPRQAYRCERASLPAGRTLVLTGSGYMIDQALNPDPYLRHTNASYGWRSREDRM